MSKKFLRLEGTKVVLIHYMPFDAVNGLGKTEAELEKEGVLVDAIPEPEMIAGKFAVAHYTPEKGVYYEYVDAPKPVAENLSLADSVKSGIITKDQYKQITGTEFVG